MWLEDPAAVPARLRIEPVALRAGLRGSAGGWDDNAREEPREGYRRDDCRSAPRQWRKACGKHDVSPCSNGGSARSQRGDRARADALPGDQPGRSSSQTNATGRHRAGARTNLHHLADARHRKAKRTATNAVEKEIPPPEPAPDAPVSGAWGLGVGGGAEDAEPERAATKGALGGGAAAN